MVKFEPAAFVPEVPHDACGLVGGEAEITLQIGGNA
jgi:hypothetical protein